MTTPDTLRYTRIPLAHGSGAIPAVGFGTLIPDPVATKQATRTALEVGFRNFDCAERYRNEEAIGDAMAAVFKAGAIKRQDVFVATRLWNTNHRPERVKPAFDASRRRLQLDYVDCYLVHTPFAFRPGDDQDPRDERGQVILRHRCHAGGHVGRAGAPCRRGSMQSSDYRTLLLKAARDRRGCAHQARRGPSRSDPYLPEWSLLDFCREHGIVLQAFAALGHAIEPRVLDDPAIKAIAQRVHKTPAQVLLAWAVQRGTSFLTTSTTPSRIHENFDISALPEDAMQEIREKITSTTRFNSVVETGVPGFIPRT